YALWAWHQEPYPFIDFCCKVDGRDTFNQCMFQYRQQYREGRHPTPHLPSSSAPPTSVILTPETPVSRTPQRNPLNSQTSLPDYRTAVATGLSTDLPPPEYD